MCVGVRVANGGMTAGNDGGDDGIMGGGAERAERRAQNYLSQGGTHSGSVAATIKRGETDQATDWAKKVRQ